jgi:hypothetical protein
MRERLLVEAEAVLEEWLRARGEAPGEGAIEGFRLLALHRQGARGAPSFNACRETCREIAYHYNLLGLDQEERVRKRRETMLAMLVEHLKLFVRGKMEVEGLGEFCCASRPLRKESETEEKAHG